MSMILLTHVSISGFSIRILSIRILVLYLYYICNISILCNMRITHRTLVNTDSAYVWTNIRVLVNPVNERVFKKTL